MRPGRRAPAARACRFVAPWYLAYLILGLIHSGMLPFLLPLAVAGAGQGLDSIAYVIGAYYTGLLPAPLLGMLAERRRLFRPIFFGGFVALAAGLAGMPVISRPGLWMALALLAGFGVGAVATMAPLFVVDFAPKPEWEARIGWLQSCNGTGQLAGLLLAGAIAGGRLAWGFWLAAGFALLALVVGRLGLPTDGDGARAGLPRLDWRMLMATFHPAPAAGGITGRGWCCGSAWRCA
jgi:MFS family permease